MKRADLESKVQITWERCPGWPAATGVEKCVASLSLRREAVLDGLVEKMFPCGPVSIRHEIGERLKRELVFALLGAHEAEIDRLRACVKKWGERACRYKYDSREDAAELEKDLEERV